MRQIKGVLLMALISLFILPVRAEKVSLEQAEKVAQNQGVHFKHAVHKAEKSSLRSSNGTEKVLYYVFENPDNQGFVIVSGDDVAVPVLGYSDSGKYDESNLNFKYWMDYLSQEIAQAIEKNVPQSAETKAKWEAYYSGNTSSLRSASSIIPLVKTLWDQGAPYYNECPDVSGTKTVTGCVATAMAQIMKYWNHPATGTGSHSYTSDTRRFTLSADFKNTTYRWSDMTNTYSTSSTVDQNSAVAELMFHCGVSVDMDYDITIYPALGSGANSQDVPGALKTYFGYDESTTYYNRDLFSVVEWKTMIKTELNLNRPVYYGGRGSGGGHAFVCDGYDNSDLFHINWGWGGSSNGYFELSALSPGALGIGGGSGGYNAGQGIITGIKPAPEGALPPEPAPKFIYASINGDATLTSLSQRFGVTTNSLFNIGDVDFSGYLGVVVCNLDNSVIQYTKIFNQAGYPVPVNLGWNTLSFSNILLPASLSVGSTYKLYPAYSLPSEPDKALFMEWADESDSYLLITVISTNQITISKPVKILPVLTLNSLDVVGKLYQTKTGQFKANITNSGIVDYNSNLVLQLQQGSTTYLRINDPVVIATGETKEIGFEVEELEVPTGDYTLNILYDPNNKRSSFVVGNAVVLGAASSSVTVLAAPSTATPPNLTLVSGPTFPNSATQVDQDNPQVTARIKNTGGYFEDDLLIFVFPVGGGSSLTYFGYQTAIIDQGETKDIVFNSSINLDAGNYRVAIFWYNINSSAMNKWTQLSNLASITLVNPPSPSTDATLQNLTISEGTLTPTFNSAITNYTVNVLNDITSITVTGTATHANTSVNGNGTKTLNVGNNVITIGTIAEDRESKQTYTITVNRNPLTATWAGTTSSDWNLPSNWTENAVPGSTTKVTIPKTGTYPVLTTNTTIDEIYFKPGAELGRQDLLTYNKAFIQYDFSETGLARGRWHMLTVPLLEAYAGDFSFDRKPTMYMKQLLPESGTIKWKSVTSVGQTLKAGEGFVVWLEEDTPGEGLAKANDIIELPHFEKSADITGHSNHVFTGVNGVGTSTFNGSTVVNRTVDAYRMENASTVNVPLNFGASGTTAFALVGNPLVATIDFIALQEANSLTIKPNYQIWTGKGAAAAYIGYTVNGNYGVMSEGSIDQFVAPMQAFIVEKENGAASDVLDFTSETIGATGATSRLRAAAVTGNKLDIVARNATAAVRTFIAKREGGSDTFGSLDARKLTDDINNIPEIYTLKPFGSSRVPVGANIINSDDLLIPMGISTTAVGKISLTFTGMDTYQAKISLLDVVENKRIDLTGLSAYEYTFNYTPVQQNGQVIANEDRFFIELKSAGGTTGWEDEPFSEIAIYASPQTIHIVSPEPVSQVSVYTLQGALVRTAKEVNAIRNINPGVYIVKAVTAKGVKTAKVIVK